MKLYHFLLIIPFFSFLYMEKSTTDINTNTPKDTMVYGKEYYSKYQGKWHAEKDKSNVLEIKNDTIIHFSNASLISKEHFLILKKCEDIAYDPAMQNRQFIGSYSKEEKKYICEYEILSDGIKTLTLMNTDNSRITVFVRMK